MPTYVYKGETYDDDGIQEILSRSEVQRLADLGYLDSDNYPELKDE